MPTPHGRCNCATAPLQPGRSRIRWAKEAQNTHKGLLVCRRHVQRHRRRRPAEPRHALIPPISHFTSRRDCLRYGDAMALICSSSPHANVVCILYSFLCARTYSHEYAEYLPFEKQALCYIARPRGCSLHGDSIARCLLRLQVQNIQQQQQGSPCICWPSHDVCLKIIARGTLAEVQTLSVRWLLKIRLVASVGCLVLLRPACARAGLRQPKVP